MPMTSSGKDKIGSGHNITKLNERVYKRGMLMFIEGEQSTEMFIIRTGKIRILKQEGDKTVELAVLGPGSVLGELSLLDHQPRSATAQVVEDLNVTVIDEAMFDHTMKSVPNWLENIVHVVVKRLRDTMKKTSDSIVKKSIAGVIKIILLLYKSEAVESKGEKRLLCNRLKDAISSTIGIGDIETENVFLHLILKEMLYIRKDDSGREYLLVRDEEVLQLYMNYLRSAQRGIAMPGENLSDEAIELLRVISEAGEKLGKVVKPGIKRVSFQQVEIEFQRQGRGQYINLDALDSLPESKILFKEQEAAGKTHQSHKHEAYLFNVSSVQKVLVLQIWLQKFKEDITL